MRKFTIVLFICAFAVMVMATVSPSAFAAGVMVHSQPGTSIPGCENTNMCFMPYQASIPVGATIVFMNIDNAAHTFTSGTPQAGSSGLFDSGLVSPGGSFFHTFDEGGEYQYFCILHTWMVGSVIVEEAVAQEPSGGVGPSIEMTIEPELPDAGEQAKLTFVGKTSDGEIWDHIDFRIIVHRAGEEIFNHEFHTHAGVLELEILPEATDFTIEIPEEGSEHEKGEEAHDNILFTRN